MNLFDFILGMFTGSIFTGAIVLFALYCVGQALEGQEDYALKAEERARAARRAEAYLEENR